MYDCQFTVKGCKSDLEISLLECAPCQWYLLFVEILGKCCISCGLSVGLVCWSLCWSTHSPLSGFRMTLSLRRSLMDWIFLLSVLMRLSSKSRTLKTKARKLFFARSIVLNPFFNYSSFRSNCSQTNSTDAIRSRSL